MAVILSKAKTHFSGTLTNDFIPYIGPNFVTAISQELARLYRCPLDVTYALNEVYIGIYSTTHNSLPEKDAIHGCFHSNSFPQYSVPGPYTIRETDLRTTTDQERIRNGGKFKHPDHQRIAATHLRVDSNHPNEGH